MSRPWISVDEDSEGTTRVLVEESHLTDFPKFMREILDAHIGLDKGVFKINIMDQQGGTNLSTFLHVIKKYYTTLRSQQKLMASGKVKTVRSYPEVQMQSFKCSRAKKEQLYGYLNSLRTSDQIKKDRNDFLLTVESPETFLNEQTCCLQALSQSLDDAENHYWQEIAASAEEDQSIPYGAGIPIESNDVRCSSNFTLSKLGTILDLCPITYPGIQQPFLYVGSKHATFPWHIEDSALFSINVLHYGSPCVWFFVPPQSYKKFVEHIPHFPLDLSQITCVNALGHKHILASKDYLQKLGITVHTVVQRENDMLVVFPFAAHSGFKCGRNIQVAINFADPWWVEPALLAPTCTCFVSQIQLDLEVFIAIARPELLQDYIHCNNVNIYKTLEKNEFVCNLGILPSGSSYEKSNKESNLLVVSAASTPDALDRSAEGAPAAPPADAPIFSGARCDIICPLKPGCKKVYKGGRCKLPRMRAHIMKEHGGDQKVIDKLNEMYPPKQRSTSNGSVCLFCGASIGGSSYHMNLHINRMHPQ